MDQVMKELKKAQAQYLEADRRRRVLMRTAKDNGTTPNEIARTLGLSMGTVQKFITQQRNMAI